MINNYFVINIGFAEGCHQSLGEAILRKDASDSFQVSGRCELTYSQCSLEEMTRFKETLDYNSGALT